MLRAIGRLRAKARAASGFTPISAEYSFTGSQTVAIPVGATTVTVECVGGGQGSTDAGGYAGGGGAYSRRDAFSVASLTGVYISVPFGGTADGGPPGGDTVVRENSAAGAIICLAKGSTSATGGSAASCIGDVKFSGGDGFTGLEGGGGGAAGPNGAGGHGSAAAGGTSGQAVGGTGGNPMDPGNAPGGGAGYASGITADGASGYIKLSWA